MSLIQFYCDVTNTHNQSLLQQNRMSHPNKRLWKEVGITKQKFDRQSQRSPSFDRTSLTKSRQGRSVSSHDSSVHKRSDFKNKVQSKLRVEAALNNFVAQINQLQIDLMQVPEQQDIQSMKNSGISMKQSYQACSQHDQTQLELLNQLFNRKKNKVNKKIKIDKEKLNRLMSQVRFLEIQHSQIDKHIKHQFDSFRIQKRKNDRVIRQITKRMSDSIYARDEQIQRLIVQNDQLKKQLFKAYDFIDQLQKQKESVNNQSKYGKFTPSNSKNNKKQQDDRTVKIRDKKRQLAIQIQEIKNRHNSFCNVDNCFKGNTSEKPSYKRNSEPNIISEYQARPSTHHQLNSPTRPYDSLKKEFDTLSNREKFKKYLHQRKKKDLMYEKSDDGLKHIRNNTQSGIKSIKYKKDSKQFLFDCKPAKQAIHNAFSLNINSLAQKFSKKSPMISVKKDHQECNINTRIQRLKSQTFLKYNSNQR